MDTHVSVPSRALASERRDAAATDERLNDYAFYYFLVSLLLAFVAVAWQLTMI